MANVKITDLPASSLPLAGSELFEVVQSSTSKNVAASDIAASFATDPANLLPVTAGGTGVATLTGYVKGNGTSDFTAVSGIAFGDISDRAYLSAYSSADQTGSISAATAVIIGTTVFSQNISITNNGSGYATRITFADAGTYMIAPSIQFTNSDTANHNANIWFRKNGTNIANSNTVINVPKASDGGNTFFQIVLYDQVSASDYIEIMWLPTNVAVTLDYIAAGAIAPAAPSVILACERIA